MYYKIHELTLQKNGRSLAVADAIFIHEMEIFNYPIEGAIALVDDRDNFIAMAFEVGSDIGPTIQIIQAVPVDGCIIPGCWEVAVVDSMGCCKTSHTSFASAWEQMNMDFVNLYQGAKK